MSQIIDGREIAAYARRSVAEQVRDLSAETGVTLGLATILIGDDPASAIYVGAKRRACVDAGIDSIHHPLSADVSRHEVLLLIDELNLDPAVSGILCQLPVPAHLDADELTNRILSEKDVDGLTIANAGRLALGIPGLRPCTPAGVIDLLAETAVSLQSRHAVVIGRSNLFGKPMAQMLLAENATVTMCHRHTHDLVSISRQADVLVAAVGQPGLVRGDWIKRGAVVIDVGINRTDAGLVGDVAFDEAREVAGAITPVPGGVGPMTIASLLRNTVEAARLQASNLSRAEPRPVVTAGPARPIRWDRW